jgi:hypothetical protein
MSVVIDKLNIPEMKLLIDITIKKNTIKENIKRLVEMEMQLDIEQRETITEIMKDHNLDPCTGYQFQSNGEIIL